MKYVLVIIFITAFLFSWLAFNNMQNRDEAFDFCSAVDVGSSSTEVAIAASNFKVQEAEPDIQLVDEVDKNSSLPNNIKLQYFYSTAQPSFGFNYGCQFEIKDNRVVLRYLTEATPFDAIFR